MKSTDQRTNPPTLKDVAARAGVAHSTVSRILNDRLADYPLRPETIRRVRQAARELNYRPNRFAQTLRSNRSKTIGLSFPLGTRSVRDTAEDREGWMQSHAVLGEIMFGAVKACEKRGYRVLILQRNTPVANHQGEQDLCPEVVDGVLFVQPDAGLKPYQELQAEGQQIVLLGGYQEGIGVPHCGINARATASFLVRHLAERGCREILFLTDHPLWLNTVMERLLGYADGLRTHGLRYNKNLVLVNNNQDPGCAGENLQRALEANPRVDGVLVATWSSLHACFTAIRRAGKKVPETLKLAAFCSGFMEEAELFQVTACHLPISRMAYEGTQLLIDRIEGKRRETYDVYVDTVFRPRRSTEPEAVAETVSTAEESLV